jgi:hypothetical protein
VAKLLVLLATVAVRDVILVKVAMEVVQAAIVVSLVMVVDVRLVIVVKVEILLNVRFVLVHLFVTLVMVTSGVVHSVQKRVTKIKTSAFYDGRLSLRV